MEGLAQTEQELLEELSALRARVTELEQALANMQQQTQELESIDTTINTLAATQGPTLIAPSRSIATPQLDEQIVALESVFEAITDGVAVYDRSGHIIRANAAFYSLFDIHAKETFSQLPLHERGQKLWMTDAHGQHLPAEYWPATRVLSGEVIDHAHPTDISFLTLDKREIQTAISGAPIYDKEHEIAGAVIVFHDITLRKAVERHTNEVLNTLLEMAEVLVQGTNQAQTDEHTSSFDPVLERLLHLGQGVLHCLRAGILLLEASTETLHPITIVGTEITEMQQWQSELAGKSLEEALQDQSALSQLHNGQAVRIAYIPIASSEQDHFYLLVPMFTGTQLFGILTLDYGQHVSELSTDELVLVAAFSKLVVLILEREELLQDRASSQANEIALLEANRRMDEFLSIASHELRTPLTTINGNIQLAKRRVKTLPITLQAPPAAIEKITLIEELLNRAERQVRVQNRMVSDLLDVSRIQANRLDLNMNSSDLIVIVREVVEDQRSSSAGRIFLSSDIPKDLQIPIVADTDRIAQVITNFLTNALKYSASDLPVEVHVQLDAKSARVSVRDQGPGLPIDEQEKLWERFYRVPGIVVQSGSGAGLGLGLHICRTIIERHNGHVGVESNIGHGSTFWFSLPIAFVPCNQPA